jgi:hypothetical protein
LLLSCYIIYYFFPRFRVGSGFGSASKLMQKFKNSHFVTEGIRITSKDEKYSEYINKIL